MANTAKLLDRAIIRVNGADARKLMQGLITNNIEKVAADRCIFAALLTPQGKFLHDFFIFQDGDDLMFDILASGVGDFIKRMKMYRLRADAGFEDESDAWAICVTFGQDNSATPGTVIKTETGYEATDPRLADIGTRSWLRAADAPNTNSTAKDYDQWLITLGIPAAGADVINNKTLMLEAGYEELQAVDFRKGCYVGQEITARSKYRANIRKRLLKVVADAPLPPEGVITCNEKHAGDLRSVSGKEAIAFMRLDYLDSADLDIDGLPVRVQKPAWVVIPEKKDD